jgi:RarD protein
MRKLFSARILFLSSMVIFGTIGVFVRQIPLPSGVLALSRAVIAILFLGCVLLFGKTRIRWRELKGELGWLLLSGAAMAINWILLFESYRYTTVATATLCYYLAPVFVVLLSPLVLKERLSLIKGICAAVAVLGMVFVSGVFEGGLDLSRLPGILFGVGAAAFYAAVILLNKKMKPIPAMDCTVIQLAAAALVLVPYTLLVEDYAAVALSPLGIGLLVAVGVVHTGIAYALYFGSVRKLPAQTVAIFSYIDPVVAILLSALFLQEPMTVWGWVGAVLILGSTLVSELSATKKHLD